MTDKEFKKFHGRIVAETAGSAAGALLGTIERLKQAPTPDKEKIAALQAEFDSVIAAWNKFSDPSIERFFEERK